VGGELLYGASSDACGLDIKSERTEIELKEEQLNQKSR